jgi:hypothetical protein
MKKLTLFFLIFTSLFSSPLVNELKHLSPQQKSVMYYVFFKTKKFNLGYTMTAIAWQESKFGKYLINLSDPSCGIMHIMPKYKVDTKWEQSRMCERLIKDKDFSIATALSIFKFWYNYYRSKGYSKNLSWRKAIISYNAGYNTDSKQGKLYLKQILLKIQALKQYFRKQNIK